MKIFTPVIREERTTMSKLGFGIQIFCVCVCVASLSRVVSGEEKKVLEPMMKSFAEVLDEKMDKVEEIQSQLREKLQRNNGLAAALYSELTTEIYNYRQGFGTRENKMVEEYAEYAYEAHFKRNDTQGCFNFLPEFAKSGRKSLDDNDYCLNRAILTGLMFLQEAENAINHGLIVIEHYIKGYVHQYNMRKDFSTTLNLESYREAERGTTAILKSAVEVELRTNPRVALLWAEFQRWYNNSFRSDMLQCTEQNSYENVQNFFLISHRYTLCCLTQNNKFCLPDDVSQ